MAKNTYKTPVTEKASKSIDFNLDFFNERKFQLTLGFASLLTAAFWLSRLSLIYRQEKLIKVWLKP